MINYKQKYIKYKNKYRKLKQSGGVFALDLTDWVSIENNGQHNCGIFLSDKYPDYLLKCENHKQKYDSIIINELKVFPKIINETYVESADKNYITMRKLDGDFTSIFFKLIPRMVANNMDLPEKIRENLLYLLDLKTPKTKIGWNSIHIGYLDYKYLTDDSFREKIREGFHSISSDNQLTIDGIVYTIPYYKNTFELFVSYLPITSYENLRKISKELEEIDPSIDVELYDEFIKGIFEEINKVYPILQNSILKIQKYLIEEKNFVYRDYKFDNFGYVLSNEPIEYYNEDIVPKLFDKYFYTYILDWESGLEKLGTLGSLEHGKEAEKKQLIANYNYGLDYMVNGQYKLSNYNNSIINIQPQEYNAEVIDNFFSPEIGKILQKKYSYKTILPDPISNIEQLNHRLNLT
jgi:hypothetical protein